MTSTARLDPVWVWCYVPVPYRKVAREIVDGEVEGTA